MVSVDYMEINEEVLQEVAEAANVSIEEIKERPQGDIESLIRMYYLKHGEFPG